MIWSATLTVGEDPNSIGFQDEGLVGDFGSLSTDSFTHDSTTYTLKGVFVWKSDNSLSLKSDPKAQDLLSGTSNKALVLELDGMEFLSAVGASAITNGYQWANSGLSWSNGDEIQVRLKIRTITTPEAPTNLRAKATGPTQFELSWDTPRDTGGLPLRAYELYGCRTSTGCDHGSEWALVDPGPGTATRWQGDRISAPATRFNIGTEYSFQVRATNAVGQGPFSEVTTASTGTFEFSKTELAVTEGYEEHYTVRLTAPPTAGVTVAITGASGDVTVNPTSLSFTTSDWNVPQTVTVTVAEDADDTDDSMVTLTHAATGGGYSGLSKTVTVQPKEPPEVTVSFGASAYEVQEGESLDVMVRLSEDPRRDGVVIPIEVDPAGTTAAADDYAVPASSVTFNRGETAKTFTLTTVLDEDEENQTVALRLGTPLPAKVGAGTPMRTEVTIHEARLLAQVVNQELLPRVAQAMIGSTLEAVAARAMVDTTSSEATGLVSELLLSSAGQDFDLKRTLAGKTFALPLGEAGGLKGLAVWGRADWRDLSGGDDRPVHWDGDLWNMQVGADVRLRANLRAGVALSWSEGKFDYRDETGRERGRYDSEMAGVYPYLNWVVPDHGLRLWTTAGYGRGEVEVRTKQSKHTSDTRLRTVAAGISGKLASTEGLLGAEGTTTLRFRADGHVSKVKADGGDRLDPLTSDIERLRAVLQGMHERALAGGRTLSPTVEVGVRYDGGDGLEGTGFELGAGLDYADPRRGLTTALHGRYVVSHSDDYDEYSFSGELRVDPGTSGRGLSLSLVPSWGASEDGLQRLWSADTHSAVEDRRPARGRLEVEVGYGLNAIAGRGTLTPYAQAAFGRNTAWRLGGRLQIKAFHLEVEGGRLGESAGAHDYGIGFQSKLQF